MMKLYTQRAIFLCTLYFTGNWIVSWLHDRVSETAGYITLLCLYDACLLWSGHKCHGQVMDQTNTAFLSLTFSQPYCASCSENNVAYIHTQGSETRKSKQTHIKNCCFCDT